MSEGEESMMLRRGRYTTKSGYQVRIDQDIRERGIGVVRDVGMVTYDAQGRAVYGHEHGVGDELDLVLPNMKKERV